MDQSKSPSSAMKSRGFHKKGARVSNIPGTKPSIHNNTLLISSGVPSLDALIGGGIAVGSCLLVDEDRFNTYSSLVMKYYIAEGVTNHHKIFIASANQPPADILQDLPRPVVHTPTARTEMQPVTDDDLSIAWRYKNLPMNESSTPAGFGHYYDVTKVMSKELLSEADVTLFDGCDPGTKTTTAHHIYCDLLNKIQECVNVHNLSTSQPSSPKNILRIAISSLDSPYWSADITEVNRFLFCLRSIIRASYCTCLITVPGHILQDIDSLIRLTDAAVEFISFSDNPEKYSKNPAFKEFHGLVKLLKLPRINSLVCQLPDTMDWVFKLKRKKLTIEKMHLPPDLSETVNRSQEDPVKSVSASCGKTLSGVNIDF